MENKPYSEDVVQMNGIKTNQHLGHFRVIDTDQNQLISAYSIGFNKLDKGIKCKNGHCWTYGGWIKYDHDLVGIPCDCGKVNYQKKN